MTGPAALSAGARAWDNALDPRVVPGAEGMRLQEVRAAREDAARPGCAAAVARHGVAVDESEAGGVPCLEILPADAVPGRVVIYLFGGGFVFGSPWQDMPVVAALAESTRARVIAPFYRLAPECPYPAGLEDAVAVIRALRDPRPVLAGVSAGATLALAAALDPELRARIGAMALISPCTDLGDYGDSYLTNRDPFLNRARVDGTPALYAPGRDLTDPGLSPVHGTYGPDYPPTLITTGTRDLFLSNCVRQERVMREAGAPVTLRVWEGMWHTFEYHQPHLPEARASLADITAFLHPHWPA